MLLWYPIRAGLLGFLGLAQTVLIVYCVLSWFLDSRSPVMRFLNRITNPVLDPIRTLLFRGTNSYGSASFAPLVALLALQVLRGLL